MNRSSVASAQSRSLKLARWRGEFQPLKNRADALEKEVADLTVKAGRSSAVGHAPATPIRDRYGVIVGYQGGGGGSGPRPLHEGEAARIRLPPTSRRSWRAAGSDARRLTRQDAPALLQVVTQRLAVLRDELIVGGVEEVRAVVRVVDEWPCASSVPWLSSC